MRRESGPAASGCSAEGCGPPSPTPPSVEAAPSSYADTAASPVELEEACSADSSQQQAQDDLPAAACSTGAPPARPCEDAPFTLEQVLRQPEALGAALRKRDAAPFIAGTTEVALLPLVPLPDEAQPRPAKQRRVAAGEEPGSRCGRPLLRQPRAPANCWGSCRRRLPWRLCSGCALGPVLMPCLPAGPGGACRAAPGGSAGEGVAPGSQQPEQGAAAGGEVAALRQHVAALQQEIAYLRACLLRSAPSPVAPRGSMAQ